MVLSDVRDKLYSTREHARQLLSNGVSDVPEELTFSHVDQVLYLNELFIIITCLFVNTVDILVAVFLYLMVIHLFLLSLAVVFY